MAFVGTGACPCACSTVIGGGARGGAGARCCAPVPITADVMMFEPGADWKDRGGVGGGMSCCCVLLTPPAPGVSLGKCTWCGSGGGPSANG